MPNLFDVFDSSYEPSGAYSFEFRERDPINGKVKQESLTELFFLLPPEEYSITEGYKITVNRTISGGWVDDFGNDFKDIQISGSLYTYYVGTPAKTSLKANSLPPLIKNLRTQGTELTNSYKKLAGAFASQIGLDIPGLELISGLDEFFKLRYILSRFRDTRASENLTSDHVMVKKFPDLQKLLDLAVSQKKLFKDIAVIYHDYDDNNHYEVTFNNFNISKSARDPFTINYKINLTGIREFSNQYSGIGFSKKREDPFAVVNDINNQIEVLNEKLLAISSVPYAIIREATTLVNMSTNVIAKTKSIITGFGINFENEIFQINQEGTRLITACNNFLNVIMQNAFLDKQGESLDDVIEKYKDEEDGYLIEDENIIQSIYLNQNMKSQGYSLQTIDKFFTEYVSDISLNQSRILYQNDFDIKINGDEEKQSSSLSVKDKFYYQVIQGDTLQSIANNFYGNYEQYTIIAEINKISNKDFEDDGMVGRNIIIPALFNSSSKQSNYNLVYYSKKGLMTPKERQIQILGNDFNLSSNRLFVVDGSGDFSLVYGEDCFVENVIDRIKYIVGSLNPVHPNWGVNIEIGSAPASIAISKFYDTIEQQISLDPRTEFVYINRELSKFEGDSIVLNLNYKPINGYSKTINISDIASGLIA